MNATVGAAIINAEITNKAVPAQPFACLAAAFIAFRMAGRNVALGTSSHKARYVAIEMNSHRTGDFFNALMLRRF